VDTSAKRAVAFEPFYRNNQRKRVVGEAANFSDALVSASSKPSIAVSEG
jgi:hypothetical protein